MPKPWQELLFSFNSESRTPSCWCNTGSTILSLRYSLLRRVHLAREDFLCRQRKSGWRARCDVRLDRNLLQRWTVSAVVNARSLSSKDRRTRTIRRERNANGSAWRMRWRSGWRSPSLIAQFRWKRSIALNWTSQKRLHTGRMARRITIWESAIPCFLLPPLCSTRVRFSPIWVWIARGKLDSATGLEFVKTVSLYVCLDRCAFTWC